MLFFENLFTKCKKADIIIMRDLADPRSTFINTLGGIGRVF